MEYIDLHVHSSASDGALSPTEVVQHAYEKKLKAMALTDHDTIDGIMEARDAAKLLGLELIPGIELSTSYLGRDVHIIGLDIDWKNRELQEKLAVLHAQRNARNEEICRRLRDLYGFDITVQALKERFPLANMTRANLSQYLVEKGYVASVQDAFARYVGDDCPAYVQVQHITPEEAIKMIRSVGGISVLAHPLLYHLTDEEIKVLALRLKEAGLIGIEAIYSSNKGNDEQRMRRLARDCGLVVSGGSDFHGKVKPGLDLATGRGNNMIVPYEVIEKLRAANL